MAKWLVSRHPGAIEWFSSQNIAYDNAVSHLDAAAVKNGDIVFGILPINLVHELNLIGARYFHIAIKLPPQLRGIELSASQLTQLGARLVEYRVAACSGNR